MSETSTGQKAQHARRHTRSRTRENLFGAAHMSLNFLGKKSFHPSNPNNLRKLHEAEERKAAEARRAAELAREHKEEETRRHARNLLQGASPAAAPSSISFMYNAPPGLREAQQKKRPRDEQAEQTCAEKDASKFELLANAPRRGAHTLDIEVHHQPFGVLLRNVKCKACGEWGHSAGDRECALRGAPASQALDEAAKLREDPLGRPSAGVETSGEALRWVPKAAAEDRVRSVHGAQAHEANQQFVTAFDEEDMATAAEGSAQEDPGGRQDSNTAAASTLADLDPEVLSLLSEKQQRKLLKMYRTAASAAVDGGASASRPGDAPDDEGHSHRESHKHRKSHHRHKSDHHHKSKHHRQSK